VGTAAWFKRSGRSLMIPCLAKSPTDADKYAKASYVWRDQHGKGMLKARARIYGNGSLLLKYLQPLDTDTYYCDVFLPDETNDTVIHNVIGIIYQSIQYTTVNTRSFVQEHQPLEQVAPVSSDFPLFSYSLLFSSFLLSVVH